MGQRPQTPGPARQAPMDARNKAGHDEMSAWRGSLHELPPFVITGPVPAIHDHRRFGQGPAGATLLFVITGLVPVIQ